MKKWVITVICLVLFLVFAGVAALMHLGTVIKQSINSYGPRMINADVHVESVRTVLLHGQANLTNFFLGNPPGFKTAYAIKASSVSIDINEASLFGNTLIIDTIEIVHPEIIYEKTRETDNFKQLVKNVNGTDNKLKTAGSTVKEEGKRLIIRNVVFRDAEVTLAISGRIGHRISARIKDIHLHDIGQKEGGLPPSEACRILLSALYSNITTPQTIIDDLGSDISRKLKAPDWFKKPVGR